jgi:hypothetical protein
MKTQTFVMVSAIIFGLAALAHVIRLSQGWVLQLGPHALPPAASWIGLVVAGALCIWGFACLRR